MKKMLFIAAVAMCVMSCGKKCENKECNEQQEAAQVEEVVAAPAEEEVAADENAEVNAVEEVTEAVEAVQEVVK